MKLLITVISLIGEKHVLRSYGNHYSGALACILVFCKPPCWSLLE
uniref:Uncharacterized protein n=1 Tax=Rhizophora mucronata TaxID=61149 RepID=A0A2P2PK72_RHIMU